MWSTHSQKHEVTVMERRSCGWALWNTLKYLTHSWMQNSHQLLCKYTSVLGKLTLWVQHCQYKRTENCSAMQRISQVSADQPNFFGLQMLDFPTPDNRYKCQLGDSLWNLAGKSMQPIIFIWKYLVKIGCLLMCHQTFWGFCPNCCKALLSLVCWPLPEAWKKQHPIWSNSNH